MTRLPEVEREFAARMGLFFDQLGGTRTMGLIYGWLIICEPAHQSISEMATVLHLSKASISTVVRQLEQAQMVERVHVPGTRQHHYQLRSGGWTQIMQARVSRLGPGAAAAEYGLDHIGHDRPDARERLEEMRDFFRFLDVEYGEELGRRWAEYRAKARAARDAGVEDA